MSSDEETEEGSYIVESIITHDTFDSLVQKASRGELVFAPECLEGKTHSKYGFLVHWKGYNVFERTWEPEANLLGNDQLHKYKRNTGMTHTKGVDVKLHRSFDPEILQKVYYNNRELSIKNQEKAARLKEKEKLRKKREEKEEAKQVQHRSSGRKTPVIEIIDPVPDLERTSTSESYKRHSVEHEAAKKVGNRKVGKSDNLELSEDSDDDSDTSTENSRNNRRRLLSPFSSSNDSIDSSSRRESISAIDKELEDIQKEQLELELAAEKLLEEEKEIVLSSDGEEEIDVVTCIAEEKEHSKPTDGISGVRQYSASLKLSTNRRSKSVEMLNERLSKHAELEVMNRTHFMINDCCRENEPRAKRVFVDELEESYKERLEKEEEVRKKLLKTNKKDVREFLRNVTSTLNDKYLESIDKLVSLYTQDNFDEARNILEQILNHDPNLVFAVIQSLILCCQRVSTSKARKLWLHRQKKMGKSKHIEFMRSDLDYIPEIGNLPQSCSDDHSKCSWLGTFLAILPIDLRFAETTGIDLLPGGRLSSNVKEEMEKGPFRDDMFLSCMELGADCQKLKFLQFGYPLGISGTVWLKYEVEYMHYVFCQGTSLKRVQQFIQLGFDINPIAFENQSNELLNLNDWIKYFWNEVEARTEESKIDPVMKKYYEELPKMMQNISERIKRMTLVEHERIFLFSNSQLNSIIPITNQHIIRCISHQNVAFGGLGEHQVNTCLFSEQGCCSSNGISNDKDSLYGKELECAEELDRLREEARSGRGRFVLAVYRVNVEVKKEDANCTKVLLPHIEFVKDDKGFKIETTRILPRYPYDPEINFLELSELHTSPGQRIYAFNNHEDQWTNLKPGLAHVELGGQFDTDMSFIVQMLFVGLD